MKYRNEGARSKREEKNNKDDENEKKIVASERYAIWTSTTYPVSR